MKPPNQFARELDATGPVLCDSLLPSARSRFLPNLPFVALRLKRVIREFKADIVHCHLRTDAAICSLLRGVPVVRTVHTVTPILPHSICTWTYLPINLLERRSLHSPYVRIAACSESAAQSLDPFLSRDGHRPATVVMNGTDLGRIKQTRAYERSQAVCNIVLIGVLNDRYKNQQMAIRALREVRDRGIDACLWLLGSGNSVEFGELERLASDLAVAERVKFCGEAGNVADHLASASICWITSRFEGFSIVAIEAMAAGLPVVSTAVGGLREILAPWPELQVKVDDYAAMADVTARLLESPERMLMVGSEMKKRAFEKFNADRMVEDYIQLYKECLPDK